MLADLTGPIIHKHHMRPMAHRGPRSRAYRIVVGAEIVSARSSKE